jgi:hypothetical protein
MTVAAVAAAAAAEPVAAAATASATGEQAGSYDIFSGLPVPGGLSERLWYDTQAEVMEALHHPFVQALAAGTLDRWAAVTELRVLVRCSMLKKMGRQYCNSLQY